jgi:hypothetical protein
MAVRTRLPWPWRVAVGVLVLLAVAGIWRWGFDRGEIFGDRARQELATQALSLQEEAKELRAQTAHAKARSSLLESELAMMNGSQASLARQVKELQTENSQLKEELGFLQRLVADSDKKVGLSIQRLAANRDHDVLHFSMLVVRGGATGDFEGNVKLQAALYQPATDAATPAQSIALIVPDEQPDLASALKLKFKYYQRVEGSFRIPPGAMLRSLTARAFESGQSKPMATQNLNFP